MPCGGIGIYTDVPEGVCWVCNKPGAKHFAEEWDAMIHARCALKWLLDDEEGRIIVDHRHRVVLDFDAEEVIADERREKEGGE